jgi:hypothetical protein
LSRAGPWLGAYKDWMICVVQNAGYSPLCKQSGIGEL